jgi:hypothetical protein
VPERKRLPRRTIALALAGFAFAAVAGVGLAQITSGTESEVRDTSSTIGSSATFPSTLPPPSTRPATATLPSAGSTTNMETETGETETGNAQPKVVICHHTGSTSNPEHTITVAEPAVQAHLANHKDTLGPCPPVTSTTAPTATTIAVTKPHHPKKPKHVTKHASNGHASTHTSSGHGHHSHHSTAPGHVKGHSHGSSGVNHGNSGGSHGNSGGSHGNSGNGNGHGK